MRLFEQNDSIYQEVCQSRSNEFHMDQNRSTGPELIGDNLSPSSGGGTGWWVAIGLAPL